MMFMSFRYYPHFFCLVSAWALSLSGEAWCSLRNERDGVPTSRAEADILVQTGIIDSSDLSDIEPFLLDPLSVPRGELTYLIDADILEQGMNPLPVTATELSDYEPWGEKEIQRFFNDYPELYSFRPILSFESAAIPHWSSTRFSFTDLTSQGSEHDMTMSYRLFPFPNLSGSGRIAVSPRNAQWQRRFCRIHFPGKTRVSLGNFSTGLSNELVYGVFPRDTVAFRTVRENWLYASRRGWNGVAADGAWRLCAELDRKIFPASGTSGTPDNTVFSYLWFGSATSNGIAMGLRHYRSYSLPGFLYCRLLPG